MRFAVIDYHGRVIRSWDTGDALRERMMTIFQNKFRFLSLRPMKRRQLENAVEEALYEMVRQFGLDVSRTH